MTIDNRFRNSFSPEDVKIFWNSVTSIYEEANANLQDIHDQRYLEALEYIQPKDNLKVLNLWSRMGRSLNYFRPAFKQSAIINMEISTDMLEISKQRYPQEQFTNTDLISIRAHDNYFDRIISLETLEHSPAPLALLREFYRVLKPGGICVLSVPPVTAEIILFIYELFAKNHGEGPHKFLSYKKVSQMIKIARFELIVHQPTLIIPFQGKILQKLNTFLEKNYTHFFLREFGLRHFYTLRKPTK